MNERAYNQRTYQVPTVLPNDGARRENLRETLAGMTRWTHLLVLQEMLQTMADHWPEGLASTSLHFGSEAGPEALFMDMKWAHPDGDIHDVREGFFQVIIDLLGPFGEGYKQTANQAFEQGRTQVTRQGLKDRIFRVTTPEETSEIKASGYHSLWSDLPTVSQPFPRF